MSSGIDGLLCERIVLLEHDRAVLNFWHKVRETCCFGIRSDTQSTVAFHIERVCDHSEEVCFLIDLTVATYIYL